MKHVNGRSDRSWAARNLWPSDLDGDDDDGVVQESSVLFSVEGHSCGVNYRYRPVLGSFFSWQGLRKMVQDPINIRPY